ncbi:MAG TPA: alginate export family protein, partial [Verrucomicrobiae bacterium]
MKNLICVMLATPLLLANKTQADDGPPRPEFRLSRQDEDWSAWRERASRTDFFDRVKFIPLDRDASAWLTLGGEARERYEYFRNANWGRGPQDHDGYFLHRFMVHADAHAGETFRFFAQFKSGLEDGRHGGPRPVDRDDFDVHQLFADVGVPWADERSLTLRVGRQELTFGSQRLVSVRESPNVRQSFDGVRARLRWEGWQFDTFATRPVETKPGAFDDGPDSHTKFWGFYGVAPFKLVPGAKADFYYLGLERDSAQFDQGNARELRHSIGTRLWGSAAGWDWNFEFVYQFGEFGDGDISAWTAASDTGFSFAQIPWSPRIGLKADVTSGDRNPNDHDLETFN